MAIWVQRRQRKKEFPLLSVLKCHPIIKSCMEGEKDYQCSLKITMFISVWFSEMYIFWGKATCALKGMDKKGWAHLTAFISHSMSLLFQNDTFAV